MEIHFQSALAAQHPLTGNICIFATDADRNWTGKDSDTPKLFARGIAAMLCESDCQSSLSRRKNTEFFLGVVFVVVHKNAPS